MHVDFGGYHVRDVAAKKVGRDLSEAIGADVLVSYLPVGSEAADRFYAQAAIDARVAFVNALPVLIVSDPLWAKKFRAAGVPIVGDDIKSQVGATITHLARRPQVGPTCDSRAGSSATRR
jgi:myo-inositol-1-phosphate synthase